MRKKLLAIILFLVICETISQGVGFSYEVVGLDDYAPLPFKTSTKTVYLKASESMNSTATTSSTTASQTLYSTYTTVNTTTMTLVQTTGRLQAPLLVIYDVELFFEENDMIRIETSGGARVYINPGLEEVEREDWTRLYIVNSTGNYKIRATTGHGSERLFVNIYRITSKTYSITITLEQTTNSTSTENITSVIETTTDLTEIKTIESFTYTTNMTTGMTEVVPGYPIDVIVFGIMVGALITLIIRKLPQNSWFPRRKHRFPY